MFDYNASILLTIGFYHQLSFNYRLCRSCFPVNGRKKNSLSLDFSIGSCMHIEYNNTLERTIQL